MTCWANHLKIRFNITIAAIAFYLASASFSTLQAKNNQEISKDDAFQSRYEFINKLNTTLKSNLDTGIFHSIKHLSTYQKNRQIIIQVIHNPLLSYSELIDDLAESGSRVNGVNFQNSLTLHILENYCNAGTFFEIQAAGLAENVVIQYEDTNGHRIAVHKINRKLCS